MDAWGCGAAYGGLNRFRVLGSACNRAVGGRCWRSSVVRLLGKANSRCLCCGDRVRDGGGRTGNICDIVEGKGPGFAWFRCSALCGVVFCVHDKACVGNVVNVG